MRHCGVHWPNGPEKFGMLSTLPASLWLMTSPEARYHYDKMRKLGKVVVWRDVPAPGNRPAELKYDARKAADAAMVLWSEQPHYGGEHFQSHCELTLNYERGDNEDDNQNLDARHQRIAKFLSDLEPALRARLPVGTRLHFPPFVPDGRSYDRLDLWRDVANRYDVISHHEYGPPEGILERVQWHLDTWPTKGVVLSEWHNDEPERTLQLLAELSDREPRFLGATWFIAHWYGAPSDWPTWKNLQDNEDLYRIFLHPPVVAQPEPAPVPEPVPIPPVEPLVMTKDEIVALIVAKAGEYGLVPWEFLGGAIAESGLDPNAERWGTWPDVSFGLFQQTVAFADEGDHSQSDANVAAIRALYEDPVHACDVAAVKFKYWRYNPEVPALTAWVAYNSPGFYHTPESSPNVENYRRALAEAQTMLGAATPSTERTYGPDVPDSVVRQQNSWSCAVRSTYAALWAMAHEGQGPSVTYGDDGANDVYNWLVPTYDDPSVGLHDHTGSGLVQVLKQHGYAAANLYPASLATVQARAGHQPVLLGGDRWSHWVMVRGVEADGTLILENPAPGFAGISDELRDSFDRLGPMAMVWIDVVGQPKEGDVTEAEANALRAENKMLRDRLGYSAGDVAAAIQKEIDTIKPSLDAAQSAVDTLKRQAA